MYTGTNSELSKLSTFHTCKNDYIRVWSFLCVGQVVQGVVTTIDSIEVAVTGVTMHLPEFGDPVTFHRNRPDPVTASKKLRDPVTRQVTIIFSTCS